MLMNRCEAEINAIRLKLYEKTKNLSCDENNKRLLNLGNELSIQYKFTIVPSAKKIDAKKISDNKFQII